MQLVIIDDILATHLPRLLEFVILSALHCDRESGSCTRTLSAVQLRFTCPTQVWLKTCASLWDFATISTCPKKMVEYLCEAG